MDETNVVAAMQASEEFRAQPDELMATSEGTVQLHLQPYALARIDA